MTRPTRDYSAISSTDSGARSRLADGFPECSSSGRQLSWQDFDWQEHLITWPGELDKEGAGHTSAMTPAFIRMVKARARRQGFDPTDPAAAGFIFPGPPHPKTKVVGPRVRGTFDGWFSDAERLAKLPPKPGRGWHSFRRKLATELRGESPQDVAAVMGWKSTRMLDVYQKAGDPAVQRALMRRRRLT